MGYKILSKKEICPNQYEITIDAPYVVRNAQAGQFIIFRADKNGERVPLTIADVDKEKGELTLVFMAVGYSTKKLAALNVGDEIADIVGPLGRPTHIKKYGTVVCLAGGYGAAPCYLIAKALKEAGNKVYMVMGARNKDLIFWQDKMENACSELFITTDDGTLGEKGFVTGVLDRIIKQEKVDYVIAVGPMPMMRAVADFRVTVGGEVKFACVDGPDFDAHKIDFDEVINRTRIYKDQEKKRSENCNLLKQAEALRS